MIIIISSNKIQKKIKFIVVLKCLLIYLSEGGPQSLFTITKVICVRIGDVVVTRADSGPVGSAALFVFAFSNWPTVWSWTFREMSLIIHLVDSNNLALLLSLSHCPSINTFFCLFWDAVISMLENQTSVSSEHKISEDDVTEKDLLKYCDNQRMVHDLKDCWLDLIKYKSLFRSLWFSE